MTCVPQSCVWEVILGMRHFTAVQMFFFSFIYFSRPWVCILCAMCICIHMLLLSDCIWIDVATKQHRSNTFWHKSERCEVLTGYLSLGRRPGGDWANTWHWTEGFTVFFWTGSSSSPSYCHILFLIAFLEEDLIRNLLITLLINNDDVLISNNCGRLQDLSLLFLIPMGTLKNLL
jgi:hypothetical protein